MTERWNPAISRLHCTALHCTALHCTCVGIFPITRQAYHKHIATSFQLMFNRLSFLATTSATRPSARPVKSVPHASCLGCIERGRGRMLVGVARSRQPAADELWRPLASDGATKVRRRESIARKSRNSAECHWITRQPTWWRHSQSCEMRCAWSWCITLLLYCNCDDGANFTNFTSNNIPLITRHLHASLPLPWTRATSPVVCVVIQALETPSLVSDDLSAVATRRLDQRRSCDASSMQWRHVRLTDHVWCLLSLARWGLWKQVSRSQFFPSFFSPLNFGLRHKKLWLGLRLWLALLCCVVVGE